jgi:peptide/nickel transport system permease protein
MLDVIRQDYIRTARAYGFSEKMVVFKYAMRNSLIPIITLFAGLLPGLIGGSVIIETIFSIPGMGRLGFEAVLTRDYPLIMGVFTISTFLTLIGLVLSDVLYAVVDPRIRLE